MTVIWTYIKPPNMTPTEYTIVSELSTLSTTMNKAFTSPGVQELKKFGFLLLFLNSLQITSCLILINTILPENLYEGIRFFASLIFYDVPVWEQESNNTKYVFDVPIPNISNRRLLSLRDSNNNRENSYLLEGLKNQVEWRKNESKLLKSKSISSRLLE
jgi:hypothetical protein